MNTIILILSLLGMLYGAWFVAVALLGSLKPCHTPGSHPSRTRFAVLIPARNEENVVGHLVLSLLRQDYPRELYDVIVIPNGCTDGTAEAAAAAGAKVLPCTVPTRSKGDVLRFAFSALGDIYDAYAILDADNLADPGFLRAMNDVLCEGSEIAQACRDSKNPSDSWVAGDTSIFFWIMNRFYNRPRSALGMSAALNGTGIVLKRSLVEKLGWNVKSLTEDLEFSGLCAAGGVKIAYAERAVVYDEQPVGLADSMTQRRRWFSGTIQCFRSLTKPLLRRHSLHALDMQILFSGCVMQIVCLIPGIATVTQILGSVIRGETTIGAVLALACGLGAAAWIACSAFALLVCALEKKLCRRRIPAILLFPLFLVSWLPANLWALFTKPPKWKAIAHVRATDKPE